MCHSGGSPMDLSLAHWHINFQFRPPFQRIWVSVDLYVHFAACCKRDFDFFSYPYVKCVFQIIHLEWIAVPFLRYDGGETQCLLQHLHTCKSAYNGQPAAGHTGYVQTLVRFVVVVVQVKPRGMQEKLVSFFHFADACSQDGMDVGRKGGFGTLKDFNIIPLACSLVINSLIWILLLWRISI